MTYSFHVPMTPVAKARPRLGRNGACFTPKKTHDAEKIIRFYFPKDKPILSCPLALIILFSMPRPKSHYKKDGSIHPAHAQELPASRPDIDNLGKLVMDALNGRAWLDDSQIVSLTMKKIFSPIGTVGIDIHISQELV